MSLTTMGWDLVYATTFSRINQILISSGRIPSTFTGGTNGGSGYAANGDWGSWSLVAGSPSNLLWLKCVVEKGTLTIPGNESIDISGSEWCVQFGLLLKPSNQEGEASSELNVLVPCDSGKSSPKIISQKCDTVTGTAYYRLIEIMNNLVVSQINALGDVFGGILLKSGNDWDIPTSAVFACESLGSNNPNIGIFALLAMTQGRQASNKQIVVDRGILDGAPAGSDGALFVGPGLVINEYLKPSLNALVPQSKLDDFAVDASTGTVIYNINELKLAISYDDDQNNSNNVIATIPKGNLQMALDGTTLHISMSNVNFPYPGWAGPGEITVAYNVQQFLTFDFILREDGGLVMVPNTDNFKNSSNITVIPDLDVQIFQIALSAAIQVLMAVIGGAVVSAASSSTQAVEEGMEAVGNGYAAQFDEAVLEGFVEEAGEEAVQNAEREAAQQGGDLVVHAGDVGYLQKFKNLIVSNKWTIIMKIIEKMVTIPVGQITTVALWLAEKEYDKAPAINNVAEACFDCLKWEDQSSFKTTGGAFNGGIVFYGKFLNK